jgi:endogenous inhibitor of DNA gyrase (YacG/DUF329 family)
MPAAPNPDRAQRPDACPRCGEPATVAHRPFCSQGCRDRDLIEWLSDGYRIPGPPVDDEDEKDLDARGLDS